MQRKRRMLCQDTHSLGHVLNILSTDMLDILVLFTVIPQQRKGTLCLNEETFVVSAFVFVLRT